MLILLICILIFFALFSYIIHRHIFNFQTIFLGIWCVILILYSFQLSYLLEDLSPKTLSYMMLVFLSFVMGYFYIFTLNLPSYKRVRSLKPNFSKIKIRINEIFLDISFYLIVIITIIQGIYSGGYPIIWLALGDHKTYFDFGIPTFNGLFLSFLLFYSMLLYIELVKNPRKKYILYFIGVILIPIIIISRQVLITLIIQLTIIHHLYIRRINFSRLLPVIILVIILFGVVGNFRTGLDNFLYISQYKGEQMNYFLSGFYWAYIYLTMQLAHINNLITYIDFDYGYGKFMFESFLPTVFLDFFYSNVTYSKPVFLVHPNFTVSSYMTSPFLDFGILGLCFYTFIIGALSCYVYHNLRLETTAKNFMIYVVLLQIIMMSFFVDFLLYLPVSFQFCWILVLKKYYQ